ncbi:MAG: HIT domain-containing protein [Anaerolineales bacterium]|nr:HIT domain-containing protein [Anaerolineales bacterium]
MSWIIPVERLHETDSLIAFHHPKPSHTFHVLLVPKRPYASLLELPPQATFLSDLVTTTQFLVERFNLLDGGYSLIANGGDYQDVPHLHFHLIAEPAATGQGEHG